MSIIGESMTISSNVAEIKDAAKTFIDENINDSDGDANYTKDELKELIYNLIDYLFE